MEIIKIKTLQLEFCEWCFEQGYNLEFQDVNEDGKVWINVFDEYSYDDKKVIRYTIDEIYNYYQKNISLYA